MTGIQTKRRKCSQVGVLLTLSSNLSILVASKIHLHHCLAPFYLSSYFNKKKKIKVEFSPYFSINQHLWPLLASLITIFIWSSNYQNLNHHLYPSLVFTQTHNLINHFSHFYMETFTNNLVSLVVHEKVLGTRMILIVFLLL